MRVEQLDKLEVKAQAVRAEGRAPQWVVPAVKVSLAVIDALIAAACFIAAFYLREGEAVVVRLGDGRLAWSAAMIRASEVSTNAV